MHLRPLLLAALLPLGIACDAPTGPRSPAAYVAVSRVQYPATLQPLGEWNYRLSVPEVPSGSWRVTVRHSFAPGTVAETVLDSIVVVPAAR